MFKDWIPQKGALWFSKDRHQGKLRALCQCKHCAQRGLLWWVFESQALWPRTKSAAQNDTRHLNMFPRKRLMTHWLITLLHNHVDATISLHVLSPPQLALATCDSGCKWNCWVSLFRASSLQFPNVPQISSVENQNFLRFTARALGWANRMSRLCSCCCKADGSSCLKKHPWTSTSSTSSANSSC